MTNTGSAFDVNGTDSDLSLVHAELLRFGHRTVHGCVFGTVESIFAITIKPALNLPRKTYCSTSNRRDIPKRQSTYVYALV